MRGLDACVAAGTQCSIWASSSDPSNSSSQIGAAIAFGIWAANYLWNTGSEPPVPVSSAPEMNAYFGAFDAQFRQLQISGYANDLFANDPVTGFVEGTGEAVYNIGADLVWMADHPEETLDALDYAINHPGETVETIAGAVWEDVKGVFSGDSKHRGKSAVELATTVGPAGVIKVLAKGKGLGKLRSIGPQTWKSSGGLVYGPDPTFGNRVRHVLAHTVPDATKPVHSVFNVPRNDVLRLVDEAWNMRGAPLPGDPGVFVVPMGRAIGTNGETAVRIVVRPGTNRIITAYPTFP